MEAWRFEPDHPALHTPAVRHPGRAPRGGYAVVLFRRRFSLPHAVSGARLWVSASQRFILHLDGETIARGPSRSDPDRWGCAEVRLGKLARVSEAPDDLADAAARWVRGEGSLKIGPRRRVRLVLDRGELTNAYPVLTVPALVPGRKRPLGPGTHLLRI